MFKGNAKSGIQPDTSLPQSHNGRLLAAPTSHLSELECTRTLLCLHCKEGDFLFHSWGKEGKSLVSSVLLPNIGMGVDGGED